MDEQEWLTSTDPQVMLEFLRTRGKTSERKVRLFAVACCRGMGHLFYDERSRKAIEVAEQFVDGNVHQKERMAAAAAAWEAANVGNSRILTGAAHAAAVAAARIADRDWPLFAPLQPAGEKAGEYAWLAVRDAGFFLDRKERSDLLRCIFSNPFCPLPTIPKSVLAWNGGTIINLATSIYKERRFEDLPILADALEEAGFTDADLLAHLRGPGPHTKGCWGLDAVLGKS